MSYTRFSSSPRDVWKISLSVCLIYLDLLTERLLWKESVVSFKGPFLKAFCQVLTLAWCFPAQDSWKEKYIHRRGTEEERCDVNLLLVTFSGNPALSEPMFVQVMGCVSIGGATSSVYSALWTCWNTLGINLHFASWDWCTIKKKPISHFGAEKIAARLNKSQLGQRSLFPLNEDRTAFSKRLSAQLCLH